MTTLQDRPARISPLFALLSLGAGFSRRGTCFPDFTRSVFGRVANGPLRTGHPRPFFDMRYVTRYVANWRVIFRLVNGDALDVDYVDYH